MSNKRLQSRVPSAVKICVARLHEHRLIFHKESKDRSAKCDAAQSENSEDVVIGVVYEIHASEKLKLDKIEGRGYGYEEKTVKVKTSEYGEIEAIIYYATKINPALKPFHWYKEHVLIGARENVFPAAYIQTIELVESIVDPVPGRHEREMQIYL